MDSNLYLNLNAPKPFNKYPTGYRPMSSGLAGSRGISGSMSSLNQFPQYSPSHSGHAPDFHSSSQAPNSYYQQQNSPYNEKYSPRTGAYTSLVDVNSNYGYSPMNQEAQRIVHRSGSVGPYGPSPFPENNLRVMSPVDHFTPSGYQQHSNNAYQSPPSLQPMRMMSPVTPSAMAHVEHDGFSHQQQPQQTRMAHENRDDLPPPVVLSSSRNYNNGGGFSSDEQSIPVQHHYTPTQSQPQERQQQHQLQPDAFLEKLRRQKEEIEKAFSRPEPLVLPAEASAYLPSEPAATFSNNQFQRSNYDNQYSSVPSTPLAVDQPPIQLSYSPEEPSFGGNPPFIHKTRSDSAVMRDYVPSQRQRLPSFTAGPSSMSRSYHEQRDGPDTWRDEGLLGRAVSRTDNYNERPVPKGGFFSRPGLLGSSSWMTDPPPPIDIQPRFRNNNNARDPNYIDRNSFLESNVMPLKDDRILKIYDPQPPLEPSRPVMNESYHSQASNDDWFNGRSAPLANPLKSSFIAQAPEPISVRTVSPPTYRSDSDLFSTNISNSQFPQHSNNFYDSGPSSPRASYISHPEPLNRDNGGYQAPMPSRESRMQQFGRSRDHQFSQSVDDHLHQPNRIQRTQSTTIPSSSYRPVERERSRTPPFDFPGSAPYQRTDVMPVFPNRSRPSPFINNTRPEDENMFSPVAAKVFPGNSRINGFTESNTKPNYPQYAKPSDNKSTFPRGERTFAIVSRPQTPPQQAPIVQAGHFSPPSNFPLARPRDFSPPSRPLASVRPEPREVTPQRQMNPIPIQRPTNLRTFSPMVAAPISTPGGIGSPGDSSGSCRSPMSPISSVYDNDSENELALKHNYHNRPQRIFSPPPHGILVKKTHEHQPRIPKKVVFQCEPDSFDRLRRGGPIFQLVAQGASGDVPPHVRAYDDAMEDVLERWNKLSDQIGGDVLAVKTKAAAVFDALRDFLWTAAGRAEPTSQEELGRLMQPLFNLVNEISTLKDANRRSPMFNHLSAVSEGIQAVGWVTVKKTPAPFVKEMVDAAMFFVNRILKEFKEGDQKHVEWVKTWKEVLETMQAFVKRTHTTGLVWNSAPGASPITTSPPPRAAGPPPPPAGGPPPPPPPPPSDLLAGLSVAPSAGDKDKSNRDALFAELNQGENVTNRLKKVTADMQTHKNPGLRVSSQVNAAGSASAGSVSSASRTSQPVQRPPKIELQDFKQWNIEYQVGNRDIVIEITDKKQTVYVYKCENSVIQVKGKANSITLDSCKKTSIVFDALVAQCETINCQSVQIQTLGELPTLSIQKTDGCQVYLSEAAKAAEIVTSKSSEMNVLIPKADGEFAEFPVPEQFKTVFAGGKLVTTASDII